MWSQFQFQFQTIFGLQRGFSEASARLPSFLTIVGIREPNFNFQTSFGLRRASSRLQQGLSTSLIQKWIINERNTNLSIQKICRENFFECRKMKCPEASETCFAQVWQRKPFQEVSCSEIPTFQSKKFVEKHCSTSKNETSGIVWNALCQSWAADSVRALFEG